MEDEATGAQSLFSRKSILKFKNKKSQQENKSPQAPFTSSCFKRMLIDNGNGLNWEDLDDFVSPPECLFGATQAADGKVRKINKTPYKILDAPYLQDDFYLNLVDWSPQNILAVGLSNSVYVWSAHTSQVKKLCDVDPDEQITSLSWSNRTGQHIAVGTSQGETQVWDINHGKLVRNFRGHLDRVSSIAWNGTTISTGSRDRMILTRDLRA